MVIINRTRPILTLNNKLSASPTLNHTRLQCNSNLPKPIPTQKVQTLAAYQKPVVPVEPVAHKELARITQDYHGVTPTTFADDTNWYPIFKFPYTFRCLVLIKLKLGLTVLSSLVGANQFYQFCLNPKLSLFGPIVITGLTLSTLTVFGYLFRQLVCHIYTTEDCQFIRISRFSFYGNRIDMILPTKSILPLTVNNTSLRKSFVNIKFIKPKDLMEGDRIEFYEEQFKFSLYYGGVTDTERFEKALGRLLSRKIQI